ncbi:hypothetical protein HC248_03021 [Polaromonas vacuolata]|uniref:Uncharacterized protein n=1 Tax=Polaromonas vacuolata TaxID=37448 RepID=A0A6H2HCS7_9BURK|nr:hypothetical protein HC248_03021 [Polaromonas vacuolata]
MGLFSDISPYLYLLSRKIMMCSSKADIHTLSISVSLRIFFVSIDNSFMVFINEIAIHIVFVELTSLSP